MPGWVVNFANTPARWNVTLDGVGYAGAQVRPASHDYGALGVPDGRHTLAFVDPRTGAVAAKIATDLHCGTPAGGTPTSGWSPTGPVEDGSIPATHPSSTPPPPAKRQLDASGRRPGRRDRPRIERSRPGRAGRVVPRCGGCTAERDAPPAPRPMSGERRARSATSTNRAPEHGSRCSGSRRHDARPVVGRCRGRAQRRMATNSQGSSV